MINYISIFIGLMGMSGYYYFIDTNDFSEKKKRKKENSDLEIIEIVDGKKKIVKSGKKADLIDKSLKEKGDLLYTKNCTYKYYKK